MPAAGFEPAIPASERPQTYALHHTGNGTGKIIYHIFENTHTAKMTLVPVTLNIFQSTL